MASAKALFVPVQLAQDRLAPQRPVQPLDGQRQHEVALQARPQHAGVKDGGEHAVILSPGYF